MDMILSFMQRLISEAMKLDPEGAKGFAPLEGKCLEIACTAPKVDLFIVVQQEQPTVSTEFAGDADVKLTGSGSDFMKAIRQGADPKSISQGKLHVAGDPEVARAFVTAVSRLDLDWEEFISGYVGDAPARKIGNAVRGLAGWAVRSSALARENLADYLVEERRLLISELKMETFTGQVNTLRADTDRLQARIDKVFAALESASEAREKSEE